MQATSTNQVLINLAREAQNVFDQTGDPDIAKAYALGLATASNYLEITRAVALAGVFTDHVVIEDIRTGDELVINHEFAADNTVTLTIEIIEGE